MAYPSARADPDCDSWLRSSTALGRPTEEIRPGDVVWFPPGEKHWHGATPTTAMTHIAIQEQLDGKTVEWMEKVSDEQYHGDRREKPGEEVMKAAIFKGKGAIELGERPDPQQFNKIRHRCSSPRRALICVCA